MKQSMIDTVIAHRIHDTRTYRYALRDDVGRPRSIWRIALTSLDTTDALSDQGDANPHGWERVYTEDE